MGRLYSAKTEGRDPIRSTYGHKHDAGFSLLEALVALAILSLVIASTQAFFNRQSQSGRKERLRDMQARLATSVSAALKSPANLYYSVARYDINPYLATCVLHVPVPGGATSDCSGSSDPDKPTRFGLFVVSSQDGKKTQQLSSGQYPNHALYYTLDGEPCPSPEADNCTFEVNTFFYASCAGDPRHCPKGPKQLLFSYEVKQKASTLPLLGKALPPLPRVKRYLAMTPGQILGPTYYSECGSGALQLANANAPDAADYRAEFAQGSYASLIGYDNYGQPKCACLYPFKKIGEQRDPETNTLVPVCQLLSPNELACPSGQYLRGIKADEENRALNCVSDSAAFECQEMPASSSTCPPGYWVQEAIQGDCRLLCEYTPDRKRSCTFSWSLTGGTTPLSDSNPGVDTVDFSCAEHKLSCCRPRVYP